MAWSPLVESLNRSLRLVARLAEAFKIGQVIGTPICFGGDVVDRLSWCVPSISQAFLTKMFISVENERTQPVPLTSIAALVPAQPSLMLLPAFVKMSGAVAGAVCGCARAATLAACSRD